MQRVKVLVVCRDVALRPRSWPSDAAAAQGSPPGCVAIQASPQDRSAAVPWPRQGTVAAPATALPRETAPMSTAVNRWSALTARPAGRRSMAACGRCRGEAI